MDQLHYKYYYTDNNDIKQQYDPVTGPPATGVKTITNQLASVKDDITTTGGEDIKDQADKNYEYDAIGNLIKDTKESITNITWNVYGRIQSITKTNPDLTTTNITYTYDAGGNRISKTVNGLSTYYVRDASGNTMAIYESNNNAVPQLTESHLYGSSRLGMATQLLVQPVTVPIVPGFGTGIFSTFTRGNKIFELSNHLGNVLVTVSDKKIGVDANSDGTIDYYTADVISAQDFYPGGMTMPGRKYQAGSSSKYRYGFNGKENDNEVKGEGNQQDYGFRIYDPRLVKFLSVDPLTEKYPQLTPYQFASNCPIAGNDLDGLEFVPRFNQSSPFSLTTNAFAKKYSGSTLNKVVDGSIHGMSKSMRNTGSFFGSDMWKLSTWKNVGAFFEQGILDMSSVKVAPTPMIDNKVQEFQDKVINGDAYTRSAYFSEFGTNLVTGVLLDKGLGELGSLKVFTNAGKTIKSASIRFTQNTVNDFGLAVDRVATGLYDPIDIVKMGDGIYSTVDNTRLLAAQKLGVNIKSNAHLFGDALPESMLQRFKNNATGEYAKTWGEAIEYRTGNQTGGFAEKHGSNGTFVQPEIKSH